MSNYENKLRICELRNTINTLAEMYTSVAQSVTTDQEIEIAVKLGEAIVTQLKKPELRDLIDSLSQELAKEPTE